MSRPNAQERRKQILRKRQAEERREADLEEVRFLFSSARRAHYEGDAPAADRLLKKVLTLDPDHEDALYLLAEIHEVAGHHGEALAYLRRLRKLRDDPEVLYNIGVVYRELHQPENSLESLREFLDAVKQLRGARW